MTTTTTATLTTPCPAWCTLPASHRMTWIRDDGSELRTHAGPQFGPYLRAYADEYADDPGCLVHVVQLVVDDDGAREAADITTVDELCQLARDALAAATWLQTQR